MKKTLLLAAAALSCTTALADWGSYEEPTSVFPTNTNDYGYNGAAGKDILWTVIYDPTLELDENSSAEELQQAKYVFRLQGIKTDGTKLFPENGLEISDYTNLSFTMYNNYVIADKDDNAIIMVQDLRNSDDTERGFTLTLYKVSPEGEMLWGEDGISPTTNTKIANLTACQACQLQDGTYVVCWQEASEYGGGCYMQRISEDGKKFYWGDEGLTISGMYPILIPAEDNQVTVVYLGSGIEAMKYDMDGETAWSKPVSVFPYSFNSMTPPYLMFNAAHMADGSTLVYWYDDRNNKQYYSPYISVVTKDGKLLFAGASDDGDVKLTTTELFSCLGLSVAPDPDGDGIVAVWRSNFASSNGVGGLVAQRVNMEGELEWGDEGLEFMEPTVRTSYSVGAILPDKSGNLAVFFDESENDGNLSGWNNMNTYVRLINAKTGDPVWKEDMVLSAKPGHVSAITGFNFPEHDCWIASWTRGIYSQSNEVRLLQRINYDGELVINGTGEKDSVSTIEAAEGSLKAYVSDETLKIYVDADTEASVEVYDLTGAKVATPFAGILAEGNNQIRLTQLSAGTYIILVNTHIGNVSIKTIL